MRVMCEKIHPLFPKDFCGCAESLFCTWACILMYKRWPVKPRHSLHSEGPSFVHRLACGCTKVVALRRVFMRRIVYTTLLYTILFTSVTSEERVGEIDANGATMAARDAPQMPQPGVGMAVTVKAIFQ